VFEEMLADRRSLFGPRNASAMLLLQRQEGARVDIGPLRARVSG